jgi:CelD/BcsL family acetyltransferase involved in cellulose biosynthesis
VPPAAPPDLERVSSFDELREEWPPLAEAAGTPFGTLEWAEAWWEVYGDGRELALHRVRAADGRLAATLPLYRARAGPLPVLRFLGHGAADELAPLCAPDDRPLAAAALLRAAAEDGRGRLVLAERMPGDAGFAGLLRGRVVQDGATPLIDIDGRTWDDWLAAKSSNFRQQARRFERKLAREHDLTFRLTEDPGDLAADLDTLVRLHEARWASEGGSDAFPEDRLQLHRAFAARALERGWLRLWTAEVGGEPAAAWYGLRYAGSEWYYQLGRDPALDRHKVGFVLLVHTIRAAFEDGMRTYRFGLGPEEYKDRFASRDPGVETIVAGAAPAVAVAAGGARLARRLPAGPRRLLRGAG